MKRKRKAKVKVRRTKATKKQVEKYALETKIEAEINAQRRMKEYEEPRSGSVNQRKKEKAKNRQGSS